MALRTIGVSAAGLGATTSASASATDRLFNPYDLGEVTNFGERVRSMTENQRERTFERISDVEIEAYADSIKPGLVESRTVGQFSPMFGRADHPEAKIESEDSIAMTVTKKRPESKKIIDKWNWTDRLTPQTGREIFTVSRDEQFANAAPTSDKTWSNPFTSTITEKTISGWDVLYQWTHKIKMGMDNNEIVDYYTNNNSSNHMTGVDKKGLKKDKQQIFSGEEFTSDKEVKFVQKIPVIGTKNYVGYPRIKMRATWDADEGEGDVSTPVKTITDSNFF